jgi:outer membrane lipoprotein-sorting protein
MRRLWGGLGIVGFMGLLHACGHTSGQHPHISAHIKNADVALEGAALSSARERMTQAQSTVSALRGTLRTTRFGAEGRVRANVTLLVARPDRFRTTLLAPHGPPLFAMACDGTQLTALDVGAQAYSQQPATAAGIAHYLGGLDLGLDGAAWVNLMLGDMVVPEHATASRAALGRQQELVWRWEQGKQRITATFDGETGLWQRADIVLGDGREGFIIIKARDAQHVPHVITLHLGAGGRGHAYEAAQDVEILLSDVAVLTTPISDDAFQIVAPPVPEL